MSTIIPAARNAFRRSTARLGVSAQATMPRYYSSTMHDNDPEVLDTEKRRNLAKEQHKTSTPIPDAPGWNETLATASEAAIKADHNSVSPQDMQKHTVDYIKGRHHSADTAMFDEPGVSTEKMKHGGTMEAQYVKEEIDGPLGSATVSETVEHKEDTIKRKRVA